MGYETKREVDGVPVRGGTDAVQEITTWRTQNAIGTRPLSNHTDTRDTIFVHGVLTASIPPNMLSNTSQRPFELLAVVPVDGLDGRVLLEGVAAQLAACASE